MRDGRLVACAQGQRAALDANPTDEQAAAIAGVLTAVLEGTSLAEIDQVAIGANGIDFASEWPGQHRELCRLTGLRPERSALVNDAIPALWGATPAPRSAIVQLGSALTSAYRPAPGAETVFDTLDLAGFYDLRREVVQVVARMLDGRLQRTGLADRILAHLGVGAAGYGEALYRQAGVRARVLTAAPVVAAAWLDGDPGAAAMIEKTIADLVLLVQAIATRLGPGDFICALGGGTLRSLPDAFQQEAAEAIARCVPGATVAAPRLAPELGAAVMACHLAGQDAAALYAELAA